MNKKVEVSIPFTPFPKEDFNVDKSSDEYGISVGKAIQYEWFAKESGVGYDSANSRFYTRWLEFHKRRLYASGNQPIGKYKNQLTTDGDMSYLNLDFKPVGIMRKFRNILVNGLVDREMSVKAVSQDIISAQKRSKFQEEIEADMLTKDILIKAQEQFGVDGFTINPDKLPEDSEELALMMNIEYKPKSEIAQEIGIDTIFKENNFYTEIRPRLITDLVDCGMATAKCEFIRNEGIRLSYVDAASLVHSFTKDPYGSDIFYFGEVKEVHINELLKINPDLTEDDLKKLAQFSNAWIDYYGGMRNYGVFNKDVVTVLYFNYKTRKNFPYKLKKTKNGGVKPISKADDEKFAFVAPNENFDKANLLKEVWYEGAMIIGTDYLLKWELSKNMMRPKSNKQKVLPNYIFCAPGLSETGYIESHTERMIPFEDQIQLTHLKLQQVKSRMIPDGVFIDVDGINEANIGLGGKAYDVVEALRLYMQTGSVFGRSTTSEGDFNNARIPIQELTKSSAGDKMQALMLDYQHQLNMLRDVIGLNQASDASTPDPDSLVGLQKIAALNSNVATRHIANGDEFTMKGAAERVSLRISDILQYSDMAEDFAMQIGKYNTDVLSEMKSLYLCDFGIFIEVAPDEEEKQLLENNIAISLKEGKIELEDAIDIRMIRNIKLANEMLKIRRKKRTKEAQERENVQMQMQAMINKDSQDAAAQAAIAKINAEAQAKIQVEEAKANGLIRVEEATAQLKSQLMDKEFALEMQTRGLDTQLQFDKINLQEDRKDARIDRQGTQQSELIDQRQKGLPPKNFESSNDNLEDLDLSSFEPK